MNVLETYLAKIAGEYDGDLPGADSRLTELLAKIAENSGGGGGSAESDTGWVDIPFSNAVGDSNATMVLRGRRVGNHVYYYFRIEIIKAISSLMNRIKVLYIYESKMPKNFPYMIDAHNTQLDPRARINELIPGMESILGNAGNDKTATLAVSYESTTHTFYVTMTNEASRYAEFKWDFFINPDDKPITY